MWSAIFFHLDQSKILSSSDRLILRLCGNWIKLLRMLRVKRKMPVSMILEFQEMLKKENHLVYPKIALKAEILELSLSPEGWHISS